MGLAVAPACGPKVLNPVCPVGCVPNPPGAEVDGAPNGLLAVEAAPNPLLGVLPNIPPLAGVGVPNPPAVAPPPKALAVPAPVPNALVDPNGLELAAGLAPNGVLDPNADVTDEPNPPVLAPPPNADVGPKPDVVVGFAAAPNPVAGGAAVPKPPNPVVVVVCGAPNPPVAAGVAPKPPKAGFAAPAPNVDVPAPKAPVAPPPPPNGEAAAELPNPLLVPDPNPPKPLLAGALELLPKPPKDMEKERRAVTTHHVILLGACHALIALYPSPDNCVSPSWTKCGMKLDGWFIGAWTTTQEDLILGDMVLQQTMLAGKRPSAEGKLRVTPGSLAIIDRLKELGLLRLYEQAGFTVGVPSCSFCVGIGKSCLFVQTQEPQRGRGRRSVTLKPESQLSESNGQGSMGNFSSAAVVAASSFDMQVMDPQPYLDAMNKEDFDRYGNWIEPDVDRATRSTPYELAEPTPVLVLVSADDEMPSAQQDKEQAAVAAVEAALPPKFHGNVQVFGDNIDSDAIIPAQFMGLNKSLPLWRLPDGSSREEAIVRVADHNVAFTLTELEEARFFSATRSISFVRRCGTRRGRVHPVVPRVTAGPVTLKQRRRRGRKARACRTNGLRRESRWKEAMQSTELEAQTVTTMHSSRLDAMHQRLDTSERRDAHDWILLARCFLRPSSFDRKGVPILNGHDVNARGTAQARGRADLEFAVAAHYL
ncbi:hypothetical protein PsorP6_001332 [Peronosclerospora sorghi]|uniref:Uncharacterized protein n=1 Tax=Peronosclerospora sorghi TaxID=230839 RepID=A0ACC0WXC2_9STRA|nr:hypothetical protein PsorP6_001332 [Peronosclerospora sorghi]